MKNSREPATWSCIWTAIWSTARIYPAINIERSGTRKEELLLHPDELQRVWTLRKAMNGVPPAEAMELIIGKLKKMKTNAEFLMTLQM